MSDTPSQRSAADIDTYGMNTPAEVHDTLMEVARMVGYDVQKAADFDVIGVVADMVALLVSDLDKAQAELEQVISG